VFQTNLVINGSGAQQSSTLSVMTAAVVSTKAGQILSGGFRGTSHFARGNNSKNAGGGASTTNADAVITNVPIDSTGIPTGPFDITQNKIQFDGNGNTRAVASTAADSFTDSYTYKQTLTPGDTPSGLGANHPNVTLNGYVGGLGQTVTFNPSNSSRGTNGPMFIITNINGVPGDVSIDLFGNSSRMAANFNVRNANGGGPTGNFQNGSLRFGVPTDTSTTTYDTTRAAYVDLTHFAARDQRIFNGIGNPSTETTTINGKGLDPNTDDSHLQLVTAAAANVASFFPGVTFCQCDETQWGLWSIHADRLDSANNIYYSDRFLDRRPDRRLERHRQRGRQQRDRQLQRPRHRIDRQQRCFLHRRRKSLEHRLGGEPDQFRDAAVEYPAARLRQCALWRHLEHQPECAVADFRHAQQRFGRANDDLHRRLLQKRDESGGQRRRQRHPEWPELHG
jgi:hypothetical protein